MQTRPITATVLLLGLGACASGALSWQGGPEPPHLLAYKQSFADAVGKRWVGGCTFERLLTEVAGKRVLWLGDDHRDAPLHAMQLQLLRRLQDSGARPVLLLEAIGEGDLGAVDRFLQCRIDMTRLRQECRQRWPDCWLDGFDVDGAFYRELLQAARLCGWPVQALEPTPRLPLQQRDDYMVRSVQRAAVRWPGRLLVVVVGQAHLLGEGDLVQRSGQPSLVLAATPPPSLPPAPPSPEPLLRSDAGIYFFAERAR